MRCASAGREPLHGGGDVGGGDHAPGHGFSVEKIFVFGFGFQGVADGVSEVEDFAHAVLFFVFADHVGLDAHGLGDEPLQRRGIFGEDLLAVLLHELEDGGLRMTPALSDS